MSTDAIPEQFTGYAAMNEADGKALQLSRWSFTPKKWAEEDVDIKITACSICGSCVHTLRSEWPSPTKYPLIAGHEIVGTVVRAGSKSGHSVGAVVGVGAQGGSCRSCDNCNAGRENWCLKGMIGTYNGKWEDGSVSQGGYADYVRTKGHFAIAIPEGLSAENAAPLMCAGITTYAPLKDLGAGPGKRVGIIGIGGLGHLGLQFSLALGADTYALSHSDSKRADAEALGLKSADDHFIVTSDIAATAKKYAGFFDILIVTANAPEPPIESLWLPLLKHGGTVNLCGLPEGKLPGFVPQMLVGRALNISGSIIGPPGQIKEMLEVARDHKIRSWTNAMPMAEATKGFADMEAGKARYRVLLKN